MTVRLPEAHKLPRSTEKVLGSNPNSDLIDRIKKSVSHACHERFLFLWEIVSTGGLSFADFVLEMIVMADLFLWFESGQEILLLPQDGVIEAIVSSREGGCSSFRPRLEVIS